ncbi:MAG: Cache 3/Cache 2 fusion domain-containing protein [Candidatus Altiarchaeota archaeon]|nr:Cache 3/Cache 2 fusion domain-containing protein [Candidatus Altiarchaeota archaeon]
MDFRVLFSFLLLFLFVGCVGEGRDSSVLEDRLSEEALLASKYAENVYEIAQSKVNSDLNVARSVLYSEGKPYLNFSKEMDFTVVNQVTGARQDISVSAFQINGRDVAYNYEVVDDVQSMVGGTATIFQVIPNGLLRVSTNVLNLDGSRAVGTYIPSDSVVYETVMKGQTYYGRAFMVNGYYLTAYEPIRDDNNKVIGVLAVGVPENEYQETVKNNLAKVSTGDRGYFWIIDSDGDYVLSYERRRDGENIRHFRMSNGTLFIQDIIDRAEYLRDWETGVYYYTWKDSWDSEAERKVAAFSYFPDWDWIILVTAYEDDFS